MNTKRTVYCKCGAFIEIIGASKYNVDRSIAAWRTEHSGEGHGPATRQVAYMARVKNDHAAKQTTPQKEDPS